jgi:pimeloyl-ACP methyl ester carboxylesterase
MRAKTLINILVAAVASLGVVGCSHESVKAATGPFSVIRMTSPDGQGEVLLRPQGLVRGLVVFTHGYAGSQDQILKSSALFPLRDDLVGAGYAIASTNAHGNNFGNPTSIKDQLQLIQDAKSRLPGVTSVDLVGFSMGGLDALMLASGHQVPGLQAVVLLSPVCDQIAYLSSYFGGSIRAAFGHANGSAPPVMARSDPERQDSRSFTGYRFWFWMSPDDTTVPPAQTASMVAILKADAVDVRYSPLSGNHGDLSQLSPADVVSWLET